MLYLRNGIWVNGSPSAKPNKSGPRKVVNRSNSDSPSSHGINFVTRPNPNRSLDPLIKSDKIRICIQRTLGGIGDIVMMTPLARGAKLKYPNSHVTFSVSLDYGNGDIPEVLYYNPYIDEIIDYKNVVKSSYHLFTDLTSAALAVEKPYTDFPNRIDLFSQESGIPIFDQPLPIYNITDEEKEWAKKYIEKRIVRGNYKGLIGIHTRSSDRRRTWPIDNAKKFINLAREKGYYSFIFGWNDDPNEWNVAGSTCVFNFKLRRAAAVLSYCDVLVCPDSSLLHIGGALNMNMVSLFGAIPPSCRINYYPYATAVVNENCACLGCVYSSCRNDVFCMKGISAERVMSEVENRLANKDTPASQPKITLNQKMIIRTIEIIGTVVSLGGDILLETLS